MYQTLCQEMMTEQIKNLLTFCMSPNTDANTFQHCTSTQRDRLVADLIAAETYRQEKRTKIGRSEDGQCTPNPSDSATTSSLMASREPVDSNSWEGLPWLCEREDIRGQLMRSWLKAQSEVPSHMWLRPSGIMTGPTPPKTTMASLDAFYQGYSELLKRKIQRRNNRKLSQQVSC
jgi:hypothetical protein